VKKIKRQTSKHEKFSKNQESGIQQIWSVGRHSFFEKTLKLAVKVFPICENHQ
jgi:hypothetical protein